MKTYLAILSVAVAVSFSAMAVSTSDVVGAKVVTVTTKSADGYLSIANGRNCLMENAQGKPALLACDRVKRPGSGEETSSLRFIVLQSGKCLSDNGTDTLTGVTCNFQDAKQQWQILTNVPTDVRNTASNKCLTASGLNNPVRITTCSGAPAQSWILP